MSETVHYKGKLTKVYKAEGETLEQVCKRLLDNQDLKSYYKTYAEMLQDVLYRACVILDDDVFAVRYQEIDPDEDIYRMTKSDTGFNFEVKYYNGGCSFNEAIAEAKRILKLREDAK